MTKIELQVMEIITKELPLIRKALQRWGHPLTPEDPNPIDQMFLERKQHSIQFLRTSNREMKLKIIELREENEKLKQVINKYQDNE